MSMDRDYREKNMELHRATREMLEILMRRMDAVEGLLRHLLPVDVQSGPGGESRETRQ